VRAEYKSGQWKPAAHPPTPQHKVKTGNNRLEIHSPE
jgi:hypothetical protein